MSTLALRSSYLWSVFRLISLTFLAFVLAAPALADSHVRIVRLSYIDGDVELDKGDGRGFNAAYMNMPVLHQSKLWARDGQAEVEFEDGSSIRLTPDTIVAFTDLSLDSDGHRTTSVELTQGTAYFDIRHRDSDAFQLQFGRERVELIKSAHFRVDSDKRDLELAVFTGEVEIASGPGSEVAVRKGETIRLDSDDSEHYDLAKGIDVENYDSWDNERANGHDQSVSTASVWGGNNGVTYGASDLNAYGSYFYVPGYGYMWRPSNASLAWDPFADGYWVQYPGFGYTFVSGYPWGWAPYRYGAWQFVNGYGWCWAPGSNWNNWNTVPSTLNMPRHFRPPLAPRNGPGTIIVNNGVATPAPEHRVIVDNDTLEHHRPHSTRVTTSTGEVIRQGQPGAAAAGQGFVATSPNTTPAASAPIVNSGVAVTPLVGGVHRGDDGRDMHHRDAEMNQLKQAGPTTAAGVVAKSPTPAPTPSVAPSHPEVRGSAPVISPRPESHISSPPMRSAGSSAGMSSTRMSSPSMSSGGGMRTSSPSMSSSGGGHVSSPSMGSASTGGGAHSSGGSSHR